MPFKSDKQRRFFGQCKTQRGRSEAHGKCPPLDVVNEYFHKEENTRSNRHNKRSKL